MAFNYKYPRPAVAVDCAVFAVDEADLKVLLIERSNEPHAGCWALPGGFMDIDETTDEAAKRELHEETGLDQVFLEQLYTFSGVDRDPRERVVSISYYALVKFSDQKVQAADDANKAEWFSVKALPELAFDHQEIFSMALERIRGKLRYQPIGFELLEEKFTLPQLQQLHETILEEELDKRNFRKKIIAMDILDELDETQTDVAHRAARLYAFNTDKYQRLINSGFNYWI